VYSRAAAEVHGDEQIFVRPHAEFARSDTDGLTGRVERRRNFAHHRRVGRVFDVENQDARMHVGTRIQTNGSSTWIADLTPAGAICAVADVKKVLEDCQCGVHASVEERILAD
jgi:hypothetical protein